MIKVRFCNDCNKQEFLNNPGHFDTECRHCGGDFYFKEISEDEVDIDVKEMKMNLYKESYNHLKWLNSWR